MRCSQCNTENSGHHRFCFGCGAPLAAGRPAPSTMASGPTTYEGERRQLTVMFCDIVDSTALSIQYDPEELREIVRMFQDTCVGVVDRYEGFVAQHLGDGLLIYFGYPRAHEDDGARAVHAGLGIIEAVSALQPRPGLRLQLRIGIATGNIVIGDLISAGANAEKVAVGPTPILAARLQGVAAPNKVVISPHTFRLLGQHFECNDLGVHQLKGISEPVRVREVIRQSNRQSRFAATYGSTVLTLVGRQEEMAQIKDRARRALEGQGQIVLFSGDAGIGKSRITRALVEHVCAQSAVKLIELQCSPYYNQSALFPVIEWLQEEVFATLSDLDDATRWVWIQRFLDRAGLDKTEVTPLFAALLSVPLPPDHAPLNLTPERQKQLTLQYLTRALRQLNPASLVLLVVEDLHWADPSTLELIRVWMADAVTSRSMTVLTARPEFAPPWAAQENLTTLTLGRLRDAHALELVQLAAGSTKLSEDEMQELVRKTDNIPLYLEVLTKHLALNSTQPPGYDRSQKNTGVEENRIPSSLQDALMAQLDRLNEAKAVAQVAAILGRDFDRKTLEAVWTGNPEALHRGLEELAKADLLQMRGEAAKGLYQFKHALIRDIAYESMLKRNCESLHCHIADVLEHSFPDVAARQPDMVAHHYTAGKKLDHAIRYWLAAGQLSLKNFATQEAVSHLNRGIALLAELPATSERDVHELEFRFLLSHALMTWKGYATEDVRITSARAHELCGLVDNSPYLPLALYQLYAYNLVSARHATALKLAKQFYQIAVQSNNNDQLVESCLTLGITYFHLGEFSEARRYLEECVQRYDPVHHAGHATHHDPAVLAYNFLIWLYWLTGQQAQADHAAVHAVSYARSLSHPLTLAFALTLSGWYRIFSHDDEQALAVSQEVIQFCGDQNIMIFLAHGHMMAAWLACDRGDTETGLPGMRRALDIYRMTGSRHFLPYWEGHYAVMSAVAGELPQAEGALTRALEQTEQTGERWSEAELHRYRGKLMERSGKPPAEAEACYRRAIAVAQQQGTVAWELRASLDLARCLLGQGAGDQARELIESLRARIPLNLDRVSAALANSLAIELGLG